MPKTLGKHHRTNELLNILGKSRRDVHAMCIKGVANDRILALKPEKYRNGKILYAPFAEFFAFQPRIDRAGHGLYGNKANAFLDLIDKFQGNVRSGTEAIAGREFNELTLEKCAAYNPGQKRPYSTAALRASAKSSSVSEE
ncbi:hypothetical protein [Roseibium salinum]|uniref:Uncharacterized protein n=1 Tax=Roseibium salinum TaxID=1604349 RepID=A0ABT3QWE2_9HYPH|nr:hypothetical protein [Roseibium sp. DSM 29163]MCX2721225.1 hypothetical protein [Roseibium sp. DSM 29163]